MNLVKTLTTRRHMLIAAPALRLAPRVGAAQQVNKLADDLKNGEFNWFPERSPGGCNDPAVSAQVTLLIGMLRLVFSFRGPGVAFGYYKSGSSLLWLLRHAECSRSDDGGRTALSASE